MKTRLRGAFFLADRPVAHGFEWRDARPRASCKRFPAPCREPPGHPPRRRDLDRNGRIDRRFGVKDSLKNDGAGPKSGHDSCQERASERRRPCQDVDMTLISDPLKEFQE